MKNACGVAILTMMMMASAHASPIVPQSATQTPHLNELVFGGDTENLELALKNGANPNEPKDKPPICTAAAANQLAGLNLLLKFKANPNVSDERGRTALSLAATNGNAQMVEALLKAGTHPNQRLNAGSTALMLTRNQDCVAALIRAKCDVNAHTANGQTALHQFCFAGNLDCVRAILKGHPKVNVQDEAGDTPLMFICNIGGNDHRSESLRIEIAQALLAAGAKPALANHEGLTPEKEARRLGFSQLADLLTEKSHG